MLFNLSQKKLILTSLFSAAILSILAWLVNNSPIFQSIDNHALIFFSQLRCPASDAFFLAVTYFGSEGFIIAACILFAVIFFIYRKTPSYILFLGTILATSNFIYFFKTLTNRVRPEIVTPVYQEVLSSFPSGHAAFAVVFYGFIAYTLANLVKTKNTQQNLLVGWIFIFILIGYSRLYLGVHFLSDVIAGYAAGFFILSVSIILLEKLLSEECPWWKRFWKQKIH